MEKLLIICEKFDAARNFANALGGETGTFEGDEYRIVSLAGHVLEFAEPYEQAYPNEAETIGKFHGDLTNSTSIVVVSRKLSKTEKTQGSIKRLSTKFQVD